MNFYRYGKYILLFFTSVFLCLIPSSQIKRKNPFFCSNEFILTLNPALSREYLEKFLQEQLSNYQLLDFVSGYALLSSPDFQSIENTVLFLEQFPDILYAEPNFSIKALDSKEDTYLSAQWALHNTGSYTIYNNTTKGIMTSTENVDMDVLETWESYSSDHPVIIAIIDTGIDYKHPDLVSNIWKNSSEIPNDGIDNDKNGYIDDIYGWDFYNKDNTVCHYSYNSRQKLYTSDPLDSDDHGTHLAGIIASKKGNGIGIAGIASNLNVQIMPLKALGGGSGMSPGTGTTFDAIKAIKYATAMKADICNLSWGNSSYSAALEQAIKESDMLFITAAGNDSRNNNSEPVYPASLQLDNLISVTGIDANGALCSFANYGTSSVDIAAPASDIVSTIVGTYGSMNGTSMAAPHVAAAAALLYSYSDYLYPENIKEVLLSTAKPMEQLTGLIKTPAIPSLIEEYYSFDSLQSDAAAPSLSFASSYDKNTAVITVNAKDTGGSGIRVIKYASGKRTKSYFKRGTAGLAVPNGRVLLSKAGIYTFYASDYAGNETISTYEVLADLKPPYLSVTMATSKNHLYKVVTISAKDNQSGIKSIKYLKGKKSIKDFSGKNGTVLEKKAEQYQFQTRTFGVYTIYALDYAGNASVFQVEITAVPPKSITLSSTKKTLACKQTYQITPSISPLDYIGSIEYSSSNPSVASVSKTGKITGLKQGKATITVTCGTNKAKIKITVIA